MSSMLISGGLGSLGRVISKKFAREGVSVFFTYRQKHEEAKEFCNILYSESASQGHTHLTHTPIELDLLNKIDGAALRQIITTHGDGIECLVNCAGITKYVEHSNLQSLGDEIIDTILHTNVKAPLVLVRELMPVIQGEKASVINITSIAARIANGSNVVYCASKSALNNITCSLARAYAPQVRFLSVAPGLLDSPFIHNASDGGDSSDTWYKEQVAKTPLNRLASLDSVADAVFFAYDSMLDSTGTILEIDGGRHLS